MKIHLEKRERKHVERFWKESQDDKLNSMFPFMKNTLDEALELYEKSEGTDSTSYGKTIYADERYIGDIWCYSIDEEKTKSCFLSIVIFDKEFWRKGIGVKSLGMFLEEVLQKYHLEKVCAFTYKSNVGSAKMLLNSGFEVIEEFVEEGIESIYFEKKI